MLKTNRFLLMMDSEPLFDKGKLVSIRIFS